MQTTLPTLYKRAASGATQQWRTWVEPGPNDTAVIHTEYGLVGGKLQHAEDVIMEGKNQGKKNATSPLEQAISEATATWTMKRDRKHYGEDAASEESAEKRALAPMLAQPYEKHAGKVDWSTAYAQPKYDGNRCIARCEGEGKERIITLTSREGKPFNLPHIADGLKSIMLPGDTFDGEVYLHGTPLNVIRSYIARLRPETETLQYHVYDMPADTVFEDRMRTLRSRFKPGHKGPLVLSSTAKVGDESTLMQYQADCIDLGFEGAILRWGQTSYEAGKRSAHLLKCKSFLDHEFAIVDVAEGRGSYKGMAVFSCLTPDGNKFEVTAPGTHDEKRYAWEHRDEYAGKMLTVKYQFMTKTDAPVPFLPVALQLR